MKIELGGGTKKTEGYINVDIAEHSDVDIVHNLNNYPYPFKNNSVEEIRAFHIIEHLDDFKKCLEECNRILKLNGKLHIKVPHFTSNGAFLEFHKLSGFWYYFLTSKRMFKKNNLEVQKLYNKFIDVKRNINFNMIYPWNWLMQLILKIPYMPQIYETTFLKALFPAKEVEIIMEKIK